MNKLFVLAVLAVACQSHGLSPLGASCAGPGDCVAGAFCVTRVCRASECQVSSDCGAGAVCVAQACTRAPASFAITSVHGDHADATAPGGYFVAQGLVVEGSGFAGDVSAQLVDTAGHVVDLLVSSANATSFHAGFADTTINTLVPADGAAMTLIVTSGGQALGRDVDILQGTPGTNGHDGTPGVDAGGAIVCNNQGVQVFEAAGGNSFSCTSATPPATTGMLTSFLARGHTTASDTSSALVDPPNGYKGTIISTSGNGTAFAAYAVTGEAIYAESAQSIAVHALAHTESTVAVRGEALSTGPLGGIGVYGSGGTNGVGTRGDTNFGVGVLAQSYTSTGTALEADGRVNFGASGTTLRVNTYVVSVSGTSDVHAECNAGGRTGILLSGACSGSGVSSEFPTSDATGTAANNDDVAVGWRCANSSGTLNVRVVCLRSY